MNYLSLMLTLLYLLILGCSDQTSTTHFNIFNNCNSSITINSGAKHIPSHTVIYRTDVLAAHTEEMFRNIGVSSEFQISDVFAQLDIYRNSSKLKIDPFNLEYWEYSKEDDNDKYLLVLTDSLF